MEILKSIIEKLNPVQPIIYQEYGTTEYTDTSWAYSAQSAYKTVPMVNRAVNFLVDSAAGVNFDIKDRITGFNNGASVIRPKKLSTLLNYRPNPYIGSNEFRRAAYLDLVLFGIAYFYWDGAYLYNLPAEDIRVNIDKKTFIKNYSYGESVVLDTSEVVRVRDNSVESLYVGTSRLNSAKETIKKIRYMIEFHSNFFKNGAIPGLILKSPNVLNKRLKTRIKDEWMKEYNPTTGGRKPLILDGDFSLERLSPNDIRELDFQESMKQAEDTILKTLGIPPVLVNSGNNANITPNSRLYYNETVLPLVNKLVSGLEMFFNYDIAAITQDILSMRPDLKELSNYYSTLVNAGIITRNEARESLRFSNSDAEIADELYLPTNIAGSAQNSNVGGRPTEEDSNE